MAFGWTYSTLSTALQEELQTTESTFVADIPTFVKAAERDIYDNTQIPELRQTSQAAVTASNEYLTLPTDFLSTYSLAVISSSIHYYLLNREQNFIREAYPNRTTTGRPRYYAQFDNDSLILAQTPDSGYSMELNYYYRPNSIVDDSTSWLGTNAPNALFYGSLIHGYIFLKGEGDMMQFYRDEYTRALANLQMMTEGRLRKDHHL